MIEHVDSLNDPRVAPYRNLKDRELASEGDRFIAEGEHLVRRLLASDFPVESVLLSTRVADEIAPLVPKQAAVYVAPDAVIHGVIGFRFHSGVMAVGKRKPSPTIDRVMPKGDRSLLLICPEIINADNLGSLMRLAAGFGVDAVVLGERCCDPFWRRCVRVSMGAVFTLPIVRSDDLQRDLTHLRDRWGVELMATVLDETAEPLEIVARPARLGVLVGSEPQGLDKKWIDACQRRITIPMKLGTDSLNVAVAAAVFLFWFTRGEAG
ncbi:MAG: RNA methyltransferase [Planctomycetes bacterium]|nr:RNA methyltransferase [Planctomycetota bacterium]